MIKEERLQLILEHLSRNQKVLLAELSDHLKVSEDTVRRDIKVLSDQGLIKAVRGGAIAHSPIPHHFRAREKHEVSQKKIIATKALQFLQHGQVVIFDGGTSTLAVAESLPRDLKITVLTNSFPIVSVLEDHPNIELIFAGGRLYKPSFTTVGHEAIKVFQNVHADLCFLGVGSIHPVIGLSALDYEDAQLKKTMVETSKQTVALSTLEKIDTAEPYIICPVTNLDALITDESPENEKLKIYKDLGILVI
ncbi:MAG: DNA-binding transcriptional regulator of sugar metabolism, DeoR/GlpR family [Daejeonella sp.]|nr:DNA-binding transcriptional regulator of sugar metabolism, DeoR/GlpR family [Daejeonella sp.]